MKKPAVYILANKKHGTLYIGVTANLLKRIWEHKQNSVPSFTTKYRIHLLVYYESHENMLSAISREKALKNWKRTWKITLIEKQNPCWHDLYRTIL